MVTTENAGNNLPTLTVRTDSTGSRTRRVLCLADRIEAALRMRERETSQTHANNSSF